MWSKKGSDPGVTFWLGRAYKQVTETQPEDILMRFNRHLLIFFLLILPISAVSALRPDDLPNTSKWYFHVDFKEMRTSEAGKHLYAWLQDEVFEDIREDTGVDLDMEADYLTAFATTDSGQIIIIEGNISQQTEDKIVAMGAASGSLDRLGSGDKAFYHVKDDDRVSINGGDIEFDIDSFDDGAYFSFAVRNKLIVTSTRELMEELLDNKGRVKGLRGGKGQLFILSADRNFMQAGANTADFDGWDSNILRNAQQAALLVAANSSGQIAIEVQLVTSEAEMADSLASIARGLISLQVFNEDMDPEIANFLQNTKVGVDGNKLTINVALDPEEVVAAIE